MVKPLRDQPNLFRRIRILQLSTVIIISILGKNNLVIFYINYKVIKKEICFLWAEGIQVIAFIGKLKDSKPITYYLSSAT